MNDPKAMYLIQYTFDQKPGDLESVTNLVPEENAISGTPIHLEFRTAHFLFTTPGSTAKLTPVVLRGYRSDWQAGVDFCKA